MKNYPCTVITLLMAVLFPAVLFAATGSAVLTDIRFEESTTGAEQVIFSLDRSAIPKVFAIKGKKPRVVFDFPATRPVASLARQIQTRGRYIERIRIGIHHKPHLKTRVVLDLRPGQNLDFDQQFLPEKHQLTIKVFTTENLTETRDQPPAADQTTQKTTSRPPDQVQEKKSAATAVAHGPDRKAKQTGEETKISPGPKDEAIPSLIGVEFDTSRSRGEMILFKLNGFYPPRVFGIAEGLPRVVCDFKDTRLDKSVQRLIKANGRYVKSIRTGRHEDRIRVVLDLKQGNNYDLQQVFFKEDNLFVLIVNTLDNAPSTAEIEKPLQRR
ncbi:AMIN domain-containing protein [Desulfolithobacter sp.]